TVDVPVLEYKVRPGAVSFRWTNCVKGFDMKIKAEMIPGRVQWIRPTENWLTLQLRDGYDGKTFIPDRNFYIKTKRSNNNEQSIKLYDLFYLSAVLPFL